MATETLNINAINEAWADASGEVTDIDEDIASADGNLYGPGTDFNPSADFGLTNPAVVVDADTVTQVDITVRLKRGGTVANVQCDVDFLIGGVVQGTEVGTGNLTTSFANYGPLNDAGWNSDWTLAQLQGAEVRLSATESGKPGTRAVDLDCCDVIVTYTPAGGGRTMGSLAGAGGLAGLGGLAGQGGGIAS